MIEQGKCHYSVQLNLIMQFRLSNGHPSGPFTGTIPQQIKRPKQPVFTYQTRQSHSRHHYYENPYLLHMSPSQNNLKNFPSSSRNSSHTRDYTETSSQKSCRLVRANGLKIAEKPKMMKYSEHNSELKVDQQSQVKEIVQRQMEIQSENKYLRNQNQLLKAKIRDLQSSKIREQQQLSNRVLRLYRMTEQLQSRMSQDEQEWRAQFLRGGQRQQRQRGH